MLRHVQQLLMAFDNVDLEIPAGDVVPM